MIFLTDEQLYEEIHKKKDLLMKRKCEESAAALEKRMRLLKELEDVTSELDLSLPNGLSSSSSSSSSSTLSGSSNGLNSSSSLLSPSIISDSSDLVSMISSSTSLQLALPPPVIVPPQQKQHKNGMFAYYCQAGKITDVDAINLKRVEEATTNSKSREADAHRERKSETHSQNKSRSVAAERTCSLNNWNSLKKLLAEDDLLLITYRNVEKRIWCSACPSYIRDDNVENHIKCGKHLKRKAIVAVENLHQSNLGTAIANSTTLSKCLSNNTHQFRCELVENLLKSGKPIAQADDLRPFLNKWSKMESTNSTHLLSDYLPIVKVCKHMHLYTFI